MALGPDGTGYFVIARDDGTHDVEVVHPVGLPSMKTGFATDAEADEWILGQISLKSAEPPQILTAL